MTASETKENPHLKKVGEIVGQFSVPAYQRGYRWGEHEVRALLDDIYADGKRDKNDSYCLQPIVVKTIKACCPSATPDETVTNADNYELIDGQQRLTTLYLIYHYLQQTAGLKIKLAFSLSYQTRPASADYLKCLRPEQRKENIDFFHMYNAYQNIADWFEAAEKSTGNALQFIAFELYGLLQNQVYVIWYDAGDVDATTLFTRLNVGRIALTNAELVKALLLSRNKVNKTAEDAQQVEISTQWDAIEKDLQDEAFWAFLTNKPGTAYPTRIEFLFDMLAEKSDKEKERFHTFLYFKRCLDAQQDRDSLAVWKPVRKRYHILREWFEDSDLYHLVGYLVAINVRVAELVRESESEEHQTKSSFRAFLSERIKASLNLTVFSARELAYDADRNKCERFLLLFNVESVRRLEHSSERYPFHSHKAEKWSLEHIHAQHAEPLTTENEWRSWLVDSKRALAALRLDESRREDDKKVLLAKIDGVLAGKVEGRIFTTLSNDIMTGFLNPANSDKSVHSIANLALLSSSVNSALSNGSFQAKRLRIIDLDRAGSFIPLCTRRVFFKYYTEAGSEQIHYWSPTDQTNYLDKMLSPEEGIGNYLIQSSEGKP